ncbi:MAG: hypothetical protein F6K38_36575 [Moorea sp. SIO3B2]|nr:hypothetical protein [Moorena sp. SIO4E2]NEP36728.1 hypothetical protein [Moorena sp. SIO3B2]NEQ06401.1 hypothetical protein [Moorena sp. SIO4E2]
MPSLIGGIDSNKLLKQHRETGDIKPQRQGGSPPGCISVLPLGKTEMHPF